MSAIRLIVGLGNPGAQYAQTRHNAGFWLVDRVAARAGLSLRTDRAFKGAVARWASDAGECWLLEPATFMNRSGESVLAFAQFYRITPVQMLVAHDELDLAPGILRLKQGGGHGGHNGLRDLQEQMSSSEFWRLRIGIGHPGHRDLVTGYVLGRPSPDETKLVDEALEQALSLLPSIVGGDFQRVMNQLHRRAAPQSGATGLD